MLKISKKLLMYGYGALFCLTLFVALMLYTQYRYFMQEAQELILVKESYYQHVDMLKRSLNASLISSESEDDEGQEDKKKNEHESVSEVITQEVKSYPEFELISQEEESRLQEIKKNRVKKSHPIKRLKRKKIIRNLSVAKPKQNVRYKPQRDFVFYWPIDLSKFWLSSLYGPRKLSNGKVSFHHAIDMAGQKGTPVKAAAGGKVIIAHYISGYGNCVMIWHNSRYKTRYAHLDSINVSQGQVVKIGELIGTVGDTGFVRKSGKDASHLHFEIYQDGIRVNPLNFLFS